MMISTDGRSARDSEVVLKPKRRRISASEKLAFAC